MNVLDLGLFDSLQALERIQADTIDKTFLTLQKVMEKVIENEDKDQLYPRDLQLNGLQNLHKTLQKELFKLVVFSSKNKAVKDASQTRDNPLTNGTE
uniref:AlNc14C211G8917 protein n=1 Tax=Albugo laibachii Nc14 TaxID=890382 RepID=F0WRB0_9STRA|nr:AlNc14C211G8917 [Albugo laibachii Nc14]|eukprot:CCA23872.1 AlNc14C211G8917 [Albugo laibachii Nc14]